MTARALTAAWVIPITMPPIPDGAVVIDGEHITLVGPRSEVLARGEFRNIEVVDFGRAAILPGLVNVHSHLELTLMRGFLEDLAFREWIVKLTRTKYEQLTDADLRASAMLGAAEAIRAGITTIADTGDTAAAFEALLASGLRGIAYREVFGPDPAAANVSLEDLKRKVSEMREHETRLVRVGVSPHAPYTVGSDLFRFVARFAIRESLDMCIHAAESESERQLLLTGEGDFARGLADRGIPWSVPGLSTVEYLQGLGVLDASPLLVHCVRVDGKDLELIRQSGSRIAHCPKSNAKLGHGVAPLDQMQATGVSVGLGTDSVASNNRCDLIDEASFCCLLHRSRLRDFTRPTSSDMLRLMTLGGAEALGLQGAIGSLEAGKQADVIAIDLSQTHNLPTHDPGAAILFSSQASDVVMTMRGGRVLFEAGELKTLDESALKHAAIDALGRMT